MMASTDRIQKLKDQLQKQSLSFFAPAQGRYSMDMVKLRMRKSIDDLITSASMTGELNPGLGES